ncbi:hypothetical protein H4219_006048 [Mycoemilia scoparia]|uniref:Uncharacterized protein n=1 Tax=Mycoemilia scoparia TaxID=417184 RepID=A0A9W7ZTC1_9FUNG|nr:hypothetical protein H4219_006048 [Mycoemilia scoparia]
MYLYKPLRTAFISLVITTYSVIAKNANANIDIPAEQEGANVIPGLDPDYADKLELIYKNPLALYQFMSDLELINPNLSGKSIFEIGKDIQNVIDKALELANEQQKFNNDDL